MELGKQIGFDGETRQQFVTEREKPRDRETQANFL